MENILFYYGTTIDPLRGGIQRVTYCLGKYFTKIGINVYYLSEKQDSDNSLESQYYLPNQDIVLTEQNRLFYIELIKSKNISFVINQHAISQSSLFVLKHTNETNAKLISVVHSSLYGIYGLSSHLTVFNKLKYQSIFSKIINKILFVAFKIKYGKHYSRLVSKSDKVVILSNKFQNEIKYFSGLKEFKDKIIAIPNPVTVDVNHENYAKIKQILFVGRFSHEKRIDLLLQIWEKLYMRHPDWSLYLVGDGEEKSAIQKMAKNMRLVNIYFEGFQHPEKYYERSTIFCMTSAYEGFGLVLVEAMAHGCIPIAFNSYPNVVDIIKNNEDGILVPPFFVEEYAEKLSNLILDTEKREEMAKQAKRKSKEFNIDIIGNHWIELFNTLLP